MSKIFWDRRLQHLQFTNVELGRRTAQVQSLNVIEIFPCDRTQIIISFRVAELFFEIWGVVRQRNFETWQILHLAPSDPCFLLSRCLRFFFVRLVGYREPYRPQEERAVTDRLKEIGKNTGGKFLSEAVQKAWIQHPNRSVVMTLAPIHISRIVRCDDFSRAISLVRFLQTDLCAPCLSKFPPWKGQSTHMQFYRFWLTPMAFNWIV